MTESLCHAVCFSRSYQCTLADPCHSGYLPVCLPLFPKRQRELELLRKEKPVIVSMGSYAASGGYYISAGADAIIADKMTLTGSIGVFGLLLEGENMLNKRLGITTDVVKTGRSADFGSNIMGVGVRKITDLERKTLLRSVDKVYETFTSKVSNGRNLPMEKVLDIAQGRVWAGADAIEIGLVDQIGTIEDAIEYAAMSIEGVSSVNDVQVVGYPKPKTTLETLLETLGGEEYAFTGTALESVEKAFRGWDGSQAGKVYARIPYEIVVR